MEAVKQGSATVGLKSKDYAVLAAFKRRPSELAAYQKKVGARVMYCTILRPLIKCLASPSLQVLPVDTHMGVSFAGLTADAKSLARWMKTECLNQR